MTDRTPLREGHREPYVGSGWQGAKRSAEIDRNELDTLPTGPHQPGYGDQSIDRYNALTNSIARWEQQAAELARDAAPADRPSTYGAPGTSIREEAESWVANLTARLDLPADQEPLNETDNYGEDGIIGYRINVAGQGPAAYVTVLYDTDGDCIGGLLEYAEWDGNARAAIEPKVARRIHLALMNRRADA